MSPGASGTLTARPARRFRLVLGLHFLLLATSLLLVTWWGTLLYRQASRISELEGRLGISVDPTGLDWTATQRMIFWESLTFFVLILVVACVLFWMYWRDELRRRGLEAFFASITHELKTPLTSIRLQAETLADDLGAQAQSRRLVERLLEDTSRLEGQVERTLELARLEGGGILFPSEIEIDSWLPRALPRWTGDEPRLKVEPRLGAGSAMVLADPHALEVIVRNILENAVRHSGRSPVEVTVTTQAGADHVAVSFRDNGAGFSGDYARLGTLFQKGPASKGSGIGLYLIRSLMRQMGGKASFSGDKGFETLLVFRRGKA